MKWKYFPISSDDDRAKAQIVENLNAGARGHTLSRKLLDCFGEARGPFLLIAFESLDLDYPYLYKYATYNGGKSEACLTDSIAWTDSTQWGLVEFLDTWLRTSRDAVVLCENWLATREEAMRGIADASWESRAISFGANEVYHVLAADARGNRALIEATLRESQYQWATGVCSRCADLPCGDVPSETFLDNIVANTEHIFVPALDEEGFLVWSPGAVYG